MSINSRENYNRDKNSTDLGYVHFYLTGHQSAATAAGGKTGVQSLAVQTGAKCPHGAPSGACPICMGKTGGGGGANPNETKPKATGMSWSEAYYVFSMIQRGKINAAEDQQRYEAVKQRNFLQRMMEATGLAQKLLEFKEFIQAQAVNVGQLAVQVKTAAINTVNMVVTPVVRTVKQAFINLTGVINKLSGVIGEQIKKTREYLRQNIDKLLQKLMEAEVISRLFKVLNEKQQNLQNFFKKMFEKIKKKKKKDKNGKQKK